MRYSIRVVAVVCGLMAFAGAARAADWNETAQGDLSGNRQSPTLINLTGGTNVISATTAGGDQEYFRLNVPAGGRINSMFLRSYAGNDGVAFIAIQQGTTFTQDPSSANPSAMLGYAHFGRGAGNVGADLLPIMGGAGQGFSGPLTAPSYTLWIQQLGSSTTYQLDVIATPEPAAGVVMMLAAGLACLRRRRVIA